MTMSKISAAGTKPTTAIPATYTHHSQRHDVHKHMITLSTDKFNHISQKIYDTLVSSVDFFKLTCVCGLSGCLISHGSYKRYVKINGAKTVLCISRVKCNICGKTHALLLSSMVPYSQILLHEHIKIIAAHTDPVKRSLVMEHNPELDENDLYHVMSQYRRHWEQRLFSHGIGFDSVSHLVYQCFSLFHRQFMQIKNTPNILYLKPT